MESAHLINKQGNLSGIFCEAANDSHLSGKKPGIVMINSGFLHHIGPNRLYTELSRGLAKLDYSSLRFDLSNIGDSLQGEQIKDIHKQTQQDISEAFSFMQKHHGCERFIVLGVCSGADDAFDIASFDSRVIGAVMIDGHGFRNYWFYLNHILIHYGRRIFSLAKWNLLARKLINRISRNESLTEEHSNELDDSIRIELSKEKVKEQIDKLSSRGCKLHFIYTGGVSEYYNHHSQFESTFPNTKHNDNVGACYIPQSDHLFMLAAHRDVVLQDIQNWIEKNYS